jgi:hypothetical protein
MPVFSRINRWFVASVAILIIAAVPTGAQGGVLGTLVPSYFYPGTGGPGGVGDGWAAMTTAATQIPLTAIFNPDSGPLPGPADPNYVAAMTNLENAGGTVVAYIYTGYGSVSLATVEGEATTYISQYGSLINGFFIDAMSTSASELPYYDSLYSFLKALSPAFDVVGNPGTATIPAYLAPGTKAADVLLTYENNDLSQPYSATPPAPWVYGFPSGDFASSVYNQPTLAGMLADVQIAPSYNVGAVYVTDQTLPNPYSQLPSYWDQEVAAIKAASALPEPGSLALWSLAGLVACFFRAPGRLRVGARSFRVRCLIVG